MSLRINRGLAGIFLAGLAGGALLRGGRPADRTHGSEDPVADPAVAMRRLGAGAASAKNWGVEDFLARLHPAESSGTQPDPSFSPATRELESWSNPEIHQALDQAALDPDSLLEKSTGHAVVDALLKEWMERDTAACLAWLEGVKSEIMRSALASRLTWPAGREEQAMRYAMQHPEVYGNGVARSDLFRRGLTAVAQRGAAAMEQALKELRQAGYPPKFTAGPILFPARFDFAALVAGPEGNRLWQQSRGELIMGWLKQDREAAFQKIQERMEGTGMALPSILQGNTPLPDAELAGWLAGKISTLGPDKLGDFIRTEASLLVADPSALSSFAGGLTDPAQRNVVHETAARAIRQLGPEAAMEHLEALGTPAERVAFLVAHPIALAFTGHADKLAAPGAAAALRATLDGWGATPEQIDLIFSGQIVTTPAAPRQ